MSRPVVRQASFADAELRTQAAGRNPRLEAIAKLLDSRRELIEKIARDLRSGLKKPRTGRAGLSAFQVLRAFVLQRIENLDLRSLSERIGDGISWRIFAGFDSQPVPRHHAFNRAFNRLTADTIRQINGTVVKWAVDAGLENGKRHTRHRTRLRGDHAGLVQAIKRGRLLTPGLPQPRALSVS